MFVLNLAILTLILVSILMTMAVMDCTIWVYLWSVGQRSSGPGYLPSTPDILTSSSPFPEGQMVSLGYAVVVAVVPMGYFNLDENIGV